MGKIKHLKTPKKFKCISCGMIFFIRRKKIKKEIKCPYCESELYHTLLSE